MARLGCVAILLATAGALTQATPAQGQVQSQPGKAPNLGRMTPEKAQKLDEQLDRTIDQYIPWLTQMYELTPDQQRVIRQRLIELKQEHIQYGETAAAEMTSLQQELKFYIEKARKGEPIDKEMVKDLQGRLVGLMEKAPFNFNNVIVQAEHYLPVEQVQAGRQRQRDLRERMAESSGRSGRMPPTIPREYEPLKPYLDLETPRGGSAGLPPIERKEPMKGPEVAPATAPATVEMIPLDAWGTYVEDFITRYQLDAKQAQQSRLILSELRKRADEYRMAHKPDYAAAEQIAQVADRNKEIARLDKPVQDIFLELKDRLDRIPSEAQRKLAEAAAATRRAKPATSTRPAAAGTRAGSSPASAPGSRSAPAPATAPARPVTAPK